jgi:hypothetical protein
MYPQTIGSWIFLLVACFLGFMIGRWINKRRQKQDEWIPRVTQTKKHLSKKERRKAGRNKPRQGGGLSGS